MRNAFWTTEKAVKPLTHQRNVFSFDEFLQLAQIYGICEKIHLGFLGQRICRVMNDVQDN